MTIAVGVDGGASTTRVLILTLDGREARRGTGPPAAVESGEAAARVVAALAREAAGEAGASLPAEALCAGLAGAGRAELRRRVEAALREENVARRVAVRTDGEIGLHDAFGGEPGLVLMAGTGSVACGRSEDGRIERAGGWGPLLGDEGSGYDVALRALRAAARMADGRAEGGEILSRILAEVGLGAPDALPSWSASASRPEIAALAPAILKAARAGDPVARRIERAAARDLADIVEALARRSGPWSRPPPVALGGGLLAAGRPLRSVVLRELRKLPVRPDDRAVEPVRGAARLALRAARRPSASGPPR